MNMGENKTYGHILELFSADCRLCETTISVLEETVKKDPALKLVVHRASECIDGSCCELAAKYGVYAVPSLIVDGSLVKVGRIGDIAEVQKYL